jgi:hypothetical protein
VPSQQWHTAASLTNFALKTANTVQKFKIPLFDPPAQLVTLGFLSFLGISGDKIREFCAKSAGNCRQPAAKTQGRARILS